MLLEPTASRRVLGRRHQTHLYKVPQDASDDVLRSKAVEDARDEGYEVDAASVAIVR